MNNAMHRFVEHEIVIDSPAGRIYELLAEVVNWPQIFPPTIYVDRLESIGTEERIKIWATANGTPKSWTSVRVLDKDNLKIEFRQEISAHPVAEMGGAWVLEAVTEHTTKVRLLHDYRAVADDPDALEWISRAVDTNSRSELHALRVNIQLADQLRDVTFSFDDSIEINAPATRAYEFINQAQLWSERLPHVVDSTFSEDEAGLQTLELQTRSANGSIHTTKSYRIAFADRRIVYKQITLPPLLALHTGCWTFVEGSGTTTKVTSQHTVVLNTKKISETLGEGATITDAREYVHRALSTNSRATLEHTRRHCENGQ